MILMLLPRRRPLMLLARRRPLMLLARRRPMMPLTCTLSGITIHVVLGMKLNNPCIACMIRMIAWEG